jgi:type I restriction enzyme, S subunit
MSDWPTAKLGGLCDADRGITYGIVKVGDYIPGGIPVIRGGDIRGNRIVFDDMKRVSPEVSSQFGRTILRGGEIVLNLIAEPGHSAVVQLSMAGFNVSRDVAVIPLSNQYNHVFVNYFLHSQEAISWLEARLNGSVTQKINLGVLREIPVPLPPRRYQDAVAEILGALDDKIAVNDRAAATAEELALVIASDERWTRTTPIGEVVSYARNQVMPETVDSEFVAHYSLPSFDAGRLPEIVAPDTIKSGKFLVSEPAVLLSKMNPATPRVWPIRPDSGIPALASTEFMVLTPIDGIDPAEVWAISMQPRFINELVGMATGTSNSHQRVRPGDLLLTHVVDPMSIPADERRTIISITERSRQARLESQALARLRDTLLPKLMSGEVRARDVEKAVEDVT